MKNQLHTEAFYKIRPKYIHHVCVNFYFTSIAYTSSSLVCKVNKHVYMTDV